MSRRTTLGFATALAVLLGLAALLGVERIGTALGSADPGRYALAVAAEVTALCLWAVPVHLFTRHVPGAAAGRRFARGYASGVFFRALLPFGRGGGGTVLAYGVARGTSAPYERVLAAVLAADALVFTASLTTLGGGLAVVTFVGGATAGTTPLLAVGLALAAYLLLTALLLGWPSLVRRAVLSLAAVLRRTVGRVSSTVGELLDPEQVSLRVGRFLDTVSWLSAHPRTVVVGLAFAQAGWLVGTLPLYYSLAAVDVQVRLAVVFFAAPAAGFAAFAPLPGGTGSVEVALGGLLVVLTSADPATIAAAVVLYRLSTYWLTVAGSGALAVALGGFTPRSPE